MVDKISVNPESVRCLGNIVSPKTQSDFDLYNSSIVPSTATINDVVKPVFGVNYRNGEYIILDYNPFEVYSEEMSTFKVKATLHKPGGDVYPGQTLSCSISTNDFLSGRTNSKGQVTFDIPASVEGVYEFRVSYVTKDGGGCSKTSKTVVGDLNNLVLLSETNITSFSDETRLFAKLTGTINNEKVIIPGVTVNFYEEYALYNLELQSSLGHVIQDDEVNVFYVIVTDEDGSRIPNQTVKLYEEYESGSLRISNSETVIGNGDVLTLTAQLRNVDGGAINGESVSFYEEYSEEGYVELTSSNKIIQTDDEATLTASVHDTDGSIIRVSGTSISVYEEYDLSNILISPSESIIESDDEINIMLIVTDEDGSRLPNQTVKLYEEYDYSKINLNTSSNPIITGDEITINAVLHDTDGSIVRGESVDINEEIDSTDWNITFNASKTSIIEDETVVLTTTILDSNETAVEGIRIRIFNEER